MSCFAREGNTFKGMQACYSITVAQLVQDACITYQFTRKGVPAAFLNSLINVLKSLADGVLVFKEELQDIIRFLSFLGTLHTTNQFVKKNLDGSNIDPFNHTDIQDSRLENIRRLFNIDEEVRLLLDSKKAIYSELFNAENVNEENRVGPIQKPGPYFDPAAIAETVQQIKFESSFINEDSKSIIDLTEYSNDSNSDTNLPDTSCEKSTKEHKRKSRKDGKNKKKKRKRYIVPTAGENGELQLNNLRQLDLQEPEDLDGVPDGEVIDVQANYNVKVTYAKPFKKYCLLGCHSGELFIIDPSRSSVLSVIKGHQGSVSGLSTWNDMIITTGSDGCILRHDVVNHTSKKIVLQEPIICSVEFNGVLFVGTIHGHIYRFNIRSMTQLYQTFQVAAGELLDIRVQRQGLCELLITCSKGNLVCIRDAQTGSLFRTLTGIQDASSVELFGPDDRYICVTCDKSFHVVEILDENTTYSYTLFIKNKDDGVQSDVLKLDIHVMSLSKFNNRLYLASNEGELFVYDSDIGLETILKLCDCPIVTMAIFRTKILFCTEDSKLIRRNLPENLNPDGELQ